MVSTAARVGSINVLLTAQFGQAAAWLDAFAGKVEHTGVRAQRAVVGIDRSVLGMNRAFAGINTRGLTGVTVAALRANTALDQMRSLALAAGIAVGGLVPAALAATMIRTVDGAHRLSNQLRTVTSDAADLKNTQDALFQVAQRTRSSFDSTVAIYARTARATDHLGLSQEKLLRITETVQKAFAVGGASTAEAQGAAIQLSQGIASDRFSGEEFRSVAENAPVLLRGMADSLGVNIGKLREMAHEGKLTAAVVTKAILDASAAIDADFAKTTSTIEQAWVRVGNAATKYAMDSKQASAGSQAIVGGLNAVSDNMSGLVDVVVALGAALVATYAGRGLNAIRQNITASGQYLTAKRLETAEIQKQMQAELALARTRMTNSRLAVQRAYRDPNFTPKQVERLEKEAARDTLLHRDAKAKLAVATESAGRALSAASLQGRAFATAGRLAAGAWAFMGGPFGAALLVAGGAMLVQAQRAADASARTDRYADAIRKAGENSGGASPSIRQVAQDLFSVGAGATSAERAVGLADARMRETSGLDDMRRAMEQALVAFGPLARAPIEVTQEIDRLYQSFRSGGMSAEEFASRLDAIARANPNLSPMIADMQRLGREVDAARGEVAGIEQQISQLDGKTANVTITIGTRRIELADGGVGEKTDRLPGISKEDFDRRFGQPYAESWKEIFPDLYKTNKSGGGGRSRKTADDRFDNSLQSLSDRTAELAREREALNLSYAEQLRREEALKLEQEALKQVREEARRKGETDWQNAQLGPEQVERINERVDAYVRESMALKEAKESQEAWNEAAGEVGGILRGVLDGTMDWRDALMELVPVVLKLMNSLNLAQGGAGIFGGGWLQSFIGGLMGISFHGGGTVGQGGRKTQIPVDAPFAGTFHGGGNFGGKRAKHGELLALVEETENILTARQTDATINALSAATRDLKSDGSMHITFGLAADGALNIMPVVRSVSREEAGKAAGQVAGAVPSMVDARNDERQTRKIRPRGSI